MGRGYERSEEQIARYVVRDLEAYLRRQFAIAALAPDFVAELYMHVLDELRARPPEENLMSSLALTVYFVTASQQPGGQIAPDSIPQLRKVIARTFEAMGPFSSVDPFIGQKEGTEHDG